MRHGISNFVFLSLATSSLVACSTTPANETGRAAPNTGSATSATAPAAATLSDAGPRAQACTTHFLDTTKYLAGFDDPEWYVDNIPFLDVPDAATNSHIQAVYYYRFSTLKRALRYTDKTNGYVFLEFLEPPAYAAAFGAIVTPSGHQLYEARWLRNTRYGDDYLNYWLNGAGKPGIRKYSSWIADSTWARYQVTSDGAFTRSMLAPLEANYDAWSDHFDQAMGLYWQTPVWDGMEYTADTYSTQNPDGDPYHGGPGFRPTINAYQYADALAIASIAGTLAGDTAAQATYKARAAALVTAMQKNLWDASSSFFVHRYKNGGALYTAGGGREEIGFVPWQFNMPAPGFEATWKDTITNPAAFYTGYGPTSVAKDNPNYLNPYAIGACCHWNGPLWPFATTQTLKAMANLLNNYSQTYVTRADYFKLLGNFAASQYKNGQPYVAEALDPNDATGAPIWTYDKPSHSEHYNHSGFVDPVITGLIGLHPSESDVVSVNPLTPAAWDHFMLENVAYHGHFLTLVWDADGTHYNAGKGFTIIQDCGVLAHQPTLGPIKATLANGSKPSTKAPRLDNVFGNAAGAAYPVATASYTNGGDAIAQLNDGLVIYDRSANGSPNDVHVHNRWTNYKSPNAKDWVQMDMGTPTAISSLTLHVYGDGGGVRAPAGYSIQTSNDGATWFPVADLKTTPEAPAQGPNVAQFAPVTTRYVRVTFTNAGACSAGTGCVGLTELEAWVAP